MRRPRQPSRPEPPEGGPRSEHADWTFLTNHAHVLMCLAADHTVRVRDVASRVGITERAVQRILAELEASGYVARSRDGRRNVYRVQSDLPLRHPIEAHHSVADLIALGGAGRGS